MQARHSGAYKVRTRPKGDISSTQHTCQLTLLQFCNPGHTQRGDMDTVCSITALVFAWCVWGLVSELLLAATHLKVLLCIGKPYPAHELSSKRTTYFVYDLLSPWLALAAVAAMSLPTSKLPAPALNTTTAGSVIAEPFMEHQSAAAVSTPPAAYPIDAISASSSNASCSATYPALQHPTQQSLQKAPMSQPLLYTTATTGSVEELLLPGHRSQSQGWDAIVTSPGSHTPSALALTSLQQLLPEALYPSATCIAAALLLLVAGHAALHLYYIASWHSQHSRNVIEMSASKDMASRLKQFRALEVVWFVLGTSYDIVTHVVVTGLLLQSMRARLGHAALTI